MKNTKAKPPALSSTGGVFQVIYEGKTQEPFRRNGQVTYFCNRLKVPVESPFMRREFLGLHFNLLSDLKYSIKDASGMMAEYQFNLVHIPEGLHNFAVPKGMYASISVEFTPEYLRVYAGYFPVLKEFLDNLQQAVPSAISKKHLNVTPQIFHILHEMLDNVFSGDQLKVYLDSKVMDLLLACLGHITHADKLFNQPYTKEEIEKIHLARNLILESLQHNQTVDMLAHKVGMNSRKLSAGFKLLFEQTIYDFLISERLKKAMALIRDTTAPLNQIAAAVGYTNATNFSFAFRKKFGIAPSSVRKLNKGKSSDDKKDEKE